MFTKRFILLLGVVSTLAVACGGSAQEADEVGAPGAAAAAETKIAPTAEAAVATLAATDEKAEGNDELLTEPLVKCGTGEVVCHACGSSFCAAAGDCPSCFKVGTHCECL